MFLASGMFVSRDGSLNKVKPSHHMMDERTQEEPQAWDAEGNPPQTLKLKN